VPPKATAFLERLLGDVEPVHLQGEAAAVDLHEGESRRHGRRALVEVEGRLALAALVVDLGEVDEGLEVLGVEPQDALEAVARLVDASRSLVGEGEVEHGDGRLRVELDRLTAGRDRRRCILAAEADRGEGEVDGGVVGVLAHQLLELPGRLVEPPRVPQGLALQQLLQQRELVLGIGGRPGAPRRYRLGSAHIAEGLQTFEGLGADLRRLRFLALLQQVPRLEVRGQRGGDPRMNARDVPQLLRVGPEVVQLGPWRPHVLPARGLDGEKLAPAVVEARVVGLGVRRGAGERLLSFRAVEPGLEADSCATIGRRLAPSRPSGTGRPTRSRSVGVRSTRRARPLTRLPASARAG
jgi:hypothetical protein